MSLVYYTSEGKNRNLLNKKKSFGGISHNSIEALKKKNYNNL